LIFPREHGAWGILLVPLITGAAAGLDRGGRADSLAPLAIAALALFWLRTPVESWLGSTPIKARTAEETGLVRNACLALSAVAAAALLWLFRGWRNPGLLWIGATAAAAFLGRTILRMVWRKRRTAAQIVGAAGLTSLAAAACYAATNRLDRMAWSLWILNFLFAANQIQFVQLRIRAGHAKNAAARMAYGRGFLWFQVFSIAFLAAACAGRLIDWYLVFAFVPIFWRGFAWYRSPFQPLAVHALGKRELAYAIAFGSMLIAGVVLG